MRKRRVQSKTSETLIAEDGDGDGDGNKGKEGKGFFACYILVSLSPRHKGQTYIGFTVNPRRRIRQHNGEIGCGALRTKKKRPWEMVLCIYGFPTNVSALQFEWAWQHPTESLAVRKAAASFKSLSGIANKIKLAYTMLTLPAWESLNITVNYFSTKYKMHSAGCPSLPEHMKVQVFPMDELPCYTKMDQSFCENEDDWDNKEECDEASSSGGFVQESPTDSIVRNSADNENNINKKANDTYGWIDGLGEDCIQPFGFSKSLVGTSSSVVSSPFSAEGISEDRDMTKDSSVEGIAEDRDTIKDSSVELRRPARKILTTTVAADNAQLPSSNCFVPCQLEIIDLSTPSPDCRTSLCGKKRRVSIIDLTKSPNFVLL